jgi:apolipoprotein N-acyltransferase
VGLLVRLLVAGLAGAAAAVSFEPLGWVYLLPLAVAAVTFVCAGERAGRGFLLGAVFGAVFMLVLLPWLQVIAVYAWLALAVVEGLFYGLAGLATAAVARLPFWPAWAACAWVLAEALRALVPFGGFPWGRLAFAVVDTPVAPSFAYVGAAGTTFLVALVGTTLAWAASRVRRKPVRALAGTAVAVLLSVAASAFPYQAVLPNADYTPVRVAAVQGDVPGRGLNAFSERRAVLDNHVEATRRLAERIRPGDASQPDLVVWPENSSDIDPYTDAAAREAIGSAARAVGVPVLMGAVVGDRVSEGWHNRAIVWSADGEPGAYYDKIHPVPFGEYIPLRSFLASRIDALDQIPNDMIPGRRTGVLQVGPARAGVLMCFEVAYDGLVHDLVDRGADVVVVPTNNATYTGTGQIQQQFAMSRLRAIETARYVVVASTNGISGIVAPDGRVVARAPVRTTAVLDEPVLLLGSVTPAVRFGGWLELGLAGVGALAVAVGLLLGRRERGSGR